MPVKFECPKCGRRFTEWGAEKNGRKCPDDEWCTHPGEEVELVRVGGPAEKPGKKPSLKRTPAKKAARAKRLPIAASDDEILAADGADMSVDEEESDVEDEDDDIVAVAKGADEEEEVEIGKSLPADEEADDEVATVADVVAVDDDVDDDDDEVVVDADDETELELGESPLIPSVEED